MDVCDNFGDAADVAADDEDLNKNHDKIWETVKALNNVRNNTGYKDACKATAYPAFVLYTRQNASQQISHFWLQESLWSTALWPRNPLLIVAKWSFVTPPVSAIWYW